jgi:hypothetical protein
LKDIEERLQNFNYMEKTEHDKDRNIINLTEKIVALEALQQDRDDVIEGVAKKVNSLSESLGENRPKRVKRKIQCADCDFVASSEHGLKIHTKRKHTITGNETYPRKCEICELEIKSNKEMRSHLKIHSYKEAIFKCEACEFIGESKYTMDAHG